MAKALLPKYNGVITASLNFNHAKQHEDNHKTKAHGVEGIHSVHERIGGVVLAGGEALRFGAPKQLLLGMGNL